MPQAVPEVQPGEDLDQELAHQPEELEEPLGVEEQLEHQVDLDSEETEEMIFATPLVAVVVAEAATTAVVVVVQTATPGDPWVEVVEEEVPL